MRHIAGCGLGLVLVSAGCAADVESAKGIEQDQFDLYESKADSFGHPTEHGELTFGAPQEAELDGEAFYHAWDFALSDAARVELRVELVTANLDSVMYLYRKSEETGRFGRYIARNDDYDGSVASRIAKELEAGDYRVLVKGYKREIRGSFRVHGQCEGPGCVRRECDTGAFESFPDAAAASCGAVVSDALSAPVRQRGSTSSTLAERCTLPDLARRAVELYYSYWGGAAGWDAIEPYEDEPVELNVAWRITADGSALIGVDAGGDEDALDVLFDPEGRVVAYYQHNQSPDFELYCEDTAGVEEECFSLYLQSSDRAADDETQRAEDVTAADAREKLDRVAFLAFEEYGRQLGLRGGETVSVTWTSWDNGGGWGWESAGRVTLETDGQPAHTYDLAAASTTQWLFTVRAEGSEPALVCREM